MRHGTKMVTLAQYLHSVNAQHLGVFVLLISIHSKGRECTCLSMYLRERDSSGRPSLSAMVILVGQ